jgi:hypothetical protein
LKEPLLMPGAIEAMSTLAVDLLCSVTEARK